MRYGDGYVLRLPKKNVQAYRRIAQKAGRIWREHGALEFRECVGDDLDVKMERSKIFRNYGQFTGLRQAASSRQTSRNSQSISISVRSISRLPHHRYRGSTGL
jgi:uncharacterized protein YbaA (DUF1428 family)